MQELNKSHEFDEKIQDLNYAILHLTNSCFVYEPKKLQFFKLVAALDKRDVSVPDFDPDKYEKIWQEVVSSGFKSKLATREVKYICCIPKIVCDENNEFINYIQKSNLTLSSKGIYGLLFSLHFSWNKYNARLAEFIKEAVLKTKTKNKIIEYWQSENRIERLVSPEGTKIFAERTVKNRLMPTQVVDEFGIRTDTCFFADYVNNIVKSIISKKGDFESNDYEYLVQVINGTKIEKEKDTFTLAYSGLIIRADSGQIEWLKKELRDTLLNHKYFGDPRIEKWVDFDTFEDGIKAKNIFIQWLSTADIKFFFTEIIKDDPHERKEFWLRYIDCIKRSRVAIGNADRYNLKEVLEKEEEKGRDFAEYNSEDTSAFILDFDTFVCVEFSKINNACYIYKKNNFAKTNDDFYKNKFNVADLKHPEYELKHSHLPPPESWKRKLGTLLAQRGIIPGRKN